MNDCGKKDYLFVIILILFRIALDWSYFILGKSQDDVEFILRIDYFKVIISYAALFVLSLPLIVERRLSTIFFRIVLFFTIVPISSVYGMRNESSAFFLLTVLTFFFAEFISLKAKSNRLKTFNIKNNSKQTTQIVIYASLIISVLTVLLMFNTNGAPSLATFVLETVYEVRQNHVSSTYLSYLLFVTTQVLVPFGIADSVVRKKPLLFIMYVVIQLLLFMWTGHKAWLFSIVLILGVLFVLKIKKSFNLIFAGVLVIVVLGNILNANDIGGAIFSLINRRVLLDPAALKFFYYDYFVSTDHQIIGFSGTLLAPFLKLDLSNNVLDYAYNISYIYTDAPSNAGTGLYGGDISNFGLLSFILVPLFLIFYSKLVDRCERNSGRTFAILLFSFLAYSLNDQRIIAYFLDFRGVILIAIVLFYSYYSTSATQPQKHDE